MILNSATNFNFFFLLIEYPKGKGTACTNMAMEERRQERTKVAIKLSHFLHPLFSP